MRKEEGVSVRVMSDTPNASFAVRYTETFTHMAVDFNTGIILDPNLSSPNWFVPYYQKH